MSDNKEQQKEAIRARFRQNDESIAVIPAKETTAIIKTAVDKVRVAIYSRVSTDNLEQVSSVTLQEDTFEKLVAEHANWELIDTYTDEGISGTSLNHREEFKRMIKDCENGKIDLIITKSVSRFARNLLDCVEYYRYLASLPHPVYIWFVTNGIDTQSSSSEMILNFFAMIAQEESRNKSEIMNWSIESRFKKGLFLTPELLGYDVDREDKTQRPVLRINEEEAQTVRQAFGMLLNGYTTQQIADVLNLLQRKSKRGNVKWSSSTVLNILKNERYCGDVLARKTYTPNYLDHKSKRNNQERNSYYKEDHHDPIISREIFRFAQKIIASHKYNMNGVIPSLSVIKEGVLKGFVSVNRSWCGVDIDDYIEACEFAYKDNTDEQADCSIQRCQVSSFDLSGFQTVSTQFFTSRERPCCTVSKGCLSFNTICIKRFKGIEYVELLFNPKEFSFAIRPCDKDNINAIEWAKFFGDGKVSTKNKGCTAFSKILFEYMQWNSNFKYKFHGVKREKADERIVFFDIKKPEVLVPDNTQSVDDKKRRKRISYYPATFVSEYGDDYYAAIYSSRLYLIDYFKIWKAYVNCEPIKDQTELIEYGKKLMMDCWDTNFPIKI